METHRIAVFDVCGTITKTNNTADFVGFVLKRDRTFKYGLLILIRILSSLFHLLGIRSIFRRDLLRDCQIALLRGYSSARIREMSELYVNGLFTKGLLNGRIMDAIKQEKNQGKTVFLVSSAIDPPIVEIARRLNIEDYFSSELEIEDGHCTGKLKTDLLGHKESVLEKIPANVNWQDSSVYSDNIEDSDFMESFGRRNVILNASEAGRIWDARKERFDFIVNFDEPRANKDVDSVNERTVKWVYIPPLYYVISRFHRQGVFSVLLREIAPVTFTCYLVTNLGAFSFVLMPLSFLMFYSMYELGGLVNDLVVKRESPGKRGTRRISAEVHLNIGLFIAIRLVLVGLILALLSVRAYPALFYAGALSCCLAISLIHTLALSHLRILTFLLLKICRNSIPLFILASRIPLATLVYLCAIYSILDAPWRVYMYGRSRGLVGGEMAVLIRCVNTAILWGMGAVLYRIAGSPHLLAIASYYVVLDCLVIIRRKWL